MPTYTYLSTTLNQHTIPKPRTTLGNTSTASPHHRITPLPTYTTLQVHRSLTPPTLYNNSTASPHHTTNNTRNIQVHHSPTPLTTLPHHRITASLTPLTTHATLQVHHSPTPLTTLHNNSTASLTHTSGKKNSHNGSRHVPLWLYTSDLCQQGK
eukprot:1366705-Amorphochlora_amoeboformis.AAC.1